MDIKEKVKQLPLSSGVYLMKNDKGKIIYIGKAISIRKRVASYFNRNSKYISKTDLLVKRIADIDFIQTMSEAEALILEASLIKEHRPKYNILLLDDKSYPLIEVTDEKFPRISVTRPQKKKKNAKYYGPYVQATLIREALKIIRKIFYFLTDEKLAERLKLDYDIGLAPAPTLELMNEKEYKDNIKNVCLILEGKKDQLYRRLQSKMEKLAQNKNFEEAAKVRDQLRAIGALYSSTKDINYYKEAEQLQRVLKLERAPERIETFDISNTFGNQTVGSMVSFLNGKPDKRNYRRFKIKTVEGIDDFSSMKEVVFRRYKRLRDENRMYPDLIVIDGGKGQLSAACAALKELEVEIPIISLAKREEEVYKPGRRVPIRFPHHQLGLQLLQRTRDEAHRFAITYHKKLRDKKFYS